MRYIALSNSASIIWWNLKLLRRYSFSPFFRLLMSRCVSVWARSICNKFLLWYGFKWKFQSFFVRKRTNNRERQQCTKVWMGCRWRDSNFDWKFSLGFGFLSFEKDEEVNKCVADHYVYVNGKKVFLFSHLNFPVVLVFFFLFTLFNCSLSLSLFFFIFEALTKF